MKQNNWQPHTDIIEADSSPRGNLIFHNESPIGTAKTPRAPRKKREEGIKIVTLSAVSLILFGLFSLSFLGVLGALAVHLLRTT
jgi:hypothetical protein